MKKRVFAIVTVIVFSFSAFCVVASATGSLVPDLLFDVMKYVYESGDFGILFGGATNETSYNDLSPEQMQEVLSNYNQSLQAQKEKVGETPASGYSTTYEQYDAYDNHVYFTITRSDIVDWCQQYYNFDCSDYNIFCYGEHTWYTNTRRLTNGYSAIEYFSFYLFPKNADITYSEDGTNFSITGSGWRTKVSFKKFSIVLNCTSDLVAYCEKFGNLVDYYQEISLSYPLDYIFVNDLTEQPLAFSSKITVTGSGSNRQLNIFLDSNKPVPHEMFAFGGILYDDGSERYDGTDRGFINGDYVSARSLQGDHHWEWHYDIEPFIEWAYRKRILNTDCFYGFVSVHRGGLNNHFISVYYADEQHLDLPSPGGIFSDVDENPRYDPPDPSPSPLFPDISFDYSPTNNYYTYNSENIENYDFSQNGDDFGSFFHWFNGAFGTFSANFIGLIDAFNGNLKLFSDNMIDFTTELGDFITGGFADISAYLGALIDKVDIDFNNQIEYFGDYFGNVMDIINHNVTVIVDNISANIELMFKPDPDYMRALLSDHLVWYYQICDLLQSKNYSSSSFSLFIPGIDYTYVFDSSVASQFKQVLTYFLYACTALSCVRIGFQIFGIHIHSGGDD